MGGGGGGAGVMRGAGSAPYNDAGDLGTSGSLLRNTVTQAYSYHGEVSVTDQFHRVWVGYPVNLKNTEDLFTEYMPGPCRRPYIARRNHLCVL